MKHTTIVADKDNFSPKACNIYRALGEVYFWENLAGGKKETVAKKADILAVGLSLNLTADFLDKFPSLKIIATQTTGLNHIDLAHAKRRGIKVLSLRGHTSFLKNIPSTAEEAWALMLALVRNIPFAFDDVKKGKWDRMKWRGHQLLGKRIGLLGLGRLGKIMAKYSKAFGMEVLACDPNVSEKAMRWLGVKKSDMKAIFRESDIVSLHVLLTDDTYNLVGEKELKLMKPSAYLINTARAELVKKGALHKALKNKWIAGAAVDVMWDEDPGGGHFKKDPLWQYAKNNKNLIIVPHIGGATFEAMQITQEFIAEKVRKYVS